MRARRISAAMAAAVISALLLGGMVTGADETEDAVLSTETEEDTGDASLDNLRNEDGIGEKELLVVSFGTSYNDSRRLTIGAIEEAMEEAFGDYDVRRAFTSDIIINHVLERDGYRIDDVKTALERAIDNGVKELVVQPTHLMDGYEYNDLYNEIAGYSDAFESVSIGEPLLTSDEDFDAVEGILTDWTEEYDDGKTAIVFMGHGTEADSNGVYQKMQDLFTNDGYENYYVGTVEAEPSLEDVIGMVKAGDYERVVLEPMMVVAGDHANNDMAGDEEDSWKSAFEAEGYEVVCLLRGLGENEDIQALYVQHAMDAGAVVSGEIASTSEMVQPEPVTEDWMVPVTADELRDGEYEIEVRSSSSMFQITSCTLTVRDGSMSAAMTMGGTGYLYVYPGTAGEAAHADEKDFIQPEEMEDGTHVFAIPVEALDAEVECAAFSRRKEKWYGRQLCFLAESLPGEAFLEERGNNDGKIDLEDGAYTVEAALDGGSGRASITSPAEILVTGGSVIARIEWSSPHYDYMIVDGEKYLPVNLEGNSVFEIPAAAFDRPLKVLADTTAMSKPYEIEYTITLDSETIKPEEDGSWAVIN